MSAKEMQIEMERRIQLISPDLTVDNKPTSEMLFSILNAAQDRFVTINYIGDDQLEVNTHSYNKNIDSIKSLLVEKELTRVSSTPLGFTKFRLPYSPSDDYLLYVKSVSKVSGTYKQLTGDQLIENDLVKYVDLPKYAQTAFNTPIVRKPAVSLMSDVTTKYNYLIVAVDKYTVLNTVILTYYRRPLRFGTIGNVATKCELPDSTHSEIVDIAVDMFITEGKYKLQTKPKSDKE